MRRIFWTIITLLVLFLLALWSPWRQWNFNVSSLFGVNAPDQVAGLQVSSLAGEIELIIDGNEAGKQTVTVEESPKVVPGLRPGTHQVQLRRKSLVEGAYWEFNRLITFEPGVDVIIAYELGPTEEFSAGHIISASSRSGGSSEVRLNVTTLPDAAAVQLDQAQLGDSPVSRAELDIGLQHKLIVSKKGYESQSFVLLPDDGESRSRLAGLDLNVEVRLFLQPLEVTDK